MNSADFVATHNPGMSTHFTWGTDMSFSLKTFTKCCLFSVSSYHQQQTCYPKQLSFHLIATVLTECFQTLVLEIQCQGHFGEFLIFNTHFSYRFITLGGLGAEDTLKCTEQVGIQNLGRGWGTDITRSITSSMGVN